jgi:aconitate hydratase 2/2-methylisocitrate dehydratase
MTGRIPTPMEYLKYTKMLDTVADETYKYLNFNELERYVHVAREVE